MDERQKEIREKGFDMGTSTYGKIKVGVKTINRTYGDKRTVLRALAEMDVDSLRDISNYFYRTSGIYQKACNYASTMYRYDWYVVPEVYDNTIKE